MSSSSSSSSSLLSSLWSKYEKLVVARAMYGKPNDFIPVPPPLPPPTSSFDYVPQRPSKPPQPSTILPHPLFKGVYIAGDHDDDDYESLFLYTRNLIPGVKSFLHQDDVVFSVQDNEVGGTVEYRQWDPFKSRLAAAILSGDAQNIWIEPGSRVLVIYSRDDAHFGITISHISDIVGPKGMVYVVEPSESNCDSLLYMADKRSNIVPITHLYSAWNYRMLINFVDVLFGAPDPRLELEARMTYLNAKHFLKTGGHYVLYVQGNCIESTNRGDPIFNSQTKEIRVQFQRMKQVTLEPFDRDHEYVSGVFRTLEIDKVDPSCLVSTKFPIPDSPRDDGRRITLYEKQYDLPVYMLFESSLGYILFLAHDVTKVERSYVHTETYINRFDEFFEIVGRLPFKSSDEALIYLTADDNNRLPNKLLKFLEQHLPPGMVDGEHRYSLGLINMGIGREIVHTAKISCSLNSSYADIHRGVRMNIEKIFKNMKPGDLEKAQRDLALMFIRQKLDSPDKGKLPKRTKKRGASLTSFPTRQNPKRKARADTKTKAADLSVPNSDVEATSDATAHLSVSK